jgi:hypothetical protein
MVEEDQEKIEAAPLFAEVLFETPKKKIGALEAEMDIEGAVIKEMIDEAIAMVHFKTPPKKIGVPEYEDLVI